MMPTANVFVKCPAGHKVLSPVFLDFIKKMVYIYCDKCKAKHGFGLSKLWVITEKEEEDEGSILHP